MGLRNALRGLVRSTDELASADRQKIAADSGADSVVSCTDRSRVTLRGTIDVLTVRPRGRTAWLEAELSDGTGHVRLIWMGRHAIPGIEAGRELVVEGRVSVVDGERRMYNPRYELR
ncbi:OB-fold nucleic acid binding domain-containing protein [Propioniciclava flava]|uniref:DNA-binding protein n=1 Tax=Propioniciclava flava TaxID=2072026 RepID=A0A4Q2EJ59_9ACTN|nr:OB-fold nucleic acid binding domain-containing protein [Propioniciclava flava]RXW33409.1 DNA-binding protein [Propioniciclava flava]